MSSAHNAGPAGPYVAWDDSSSEDAPPEVAQEMAELHCMNSCPVSAASAGTAMERFEKARCTDTCYRLAANPQAGDCQPWSVGRCRGHGSGARSAPGLGADQLMEAAGRGSAGSVLNGRPSEPRW